MTGLRLLALAHRGRELAGVLLVMTVLSWLAYGGAFDIQMTLLNPPHKITYLELIAVVTAILNAALCRPRFWEWERLGAGRTRIAAGGFALLGILHPLVPLMAGASRLPGTVRWGWLVSNVLTIGAVTFVLSALIGAALAGGLVLTLYFAEAVVDNLAHGAAPYLPLASYHDQTPRWPLTILLCLVAVALAVYTHGTSTWAHRLARNEE
jgi:hypothetical protein